MPIKKIAPDFQFFRYSQLSVTVKDEEGIFLVVITSAGSLGTRPATARQIGNAILAAADEAEACQKAMEMEKETHD